MTINLWTSETDRTIKKGNYWAMVRILEDDETHEKYYDVFLGEQGEKFKAHFSYNLDGERRRDDALRNKIQKIRKEKESKIHGKLEDETTIIKNTIPKCDLKFRVEYDENTGESKISIFEIILK